MAVAPPRTTSIYWHVRNDAVMAQDRGSFDLLLTSLLRVVAQDIS
jgi:hypothetical protein